MSDSKGHGLEKEVVKIITIRVCLEHENGEGNRNVITPSINSHV